MLAVFKGLAEEWVEIRTPTQTLRATPDHPFFVDSDRMRTAGTLMPGMALLTSDAVGKVSVQAVISVRLHHSPLRIVNLTTGWPNTLLAGSAIVHNKGGCFLPETPVRLWGGGARAISALTPGDEVLAFDGDGSPVRTTVRGVITVEREGYHEIETDSGIRVSATAEHPFYVGRGEFRLVESLKEGDFVQTFTDRMVPSRIRSIRYIAKPVRVYNLQTDDPNTFIASDFAVHNKGGGGWGGSGGSGSRRRAFSYHHAGRAFSNCGDIPDLAARQDCNRQKREQVFMGSLLGLLSLLLAVVWQGLEGLMARIHQSNFRVDSKDVEPRADGVEGLMRGLSAKKAYFDPESCKKTTTRAFLTLQKVWEARNYGEMAPLVFPDLREAHENQIEAMKRVHEINRMRHLKVNFVRIIGLAECPSENREKFIALIEAEAQDDYIDDRTGWVLRGDTAVSTFQEFWTFQYRAGKWLLREIDQVADSRSRILGSEIRVEMEGLSVPDRLELQGLPSAGLSKMERLIRAYRASDPAWNAVAMSQKAKACALAWFHSLERGDSQLLRENSMEELLQDLSGILEKQTREQETIQFLNLCVRSVEIVHVGRLPDVFTARVRLHAQRIRMKSGEIVSRDPDVVAFETLVEFRKPGNGFLLDRVWD